jgi:hypothetical protein
MSDANSLILSKESSRLQLFRPHPSPEPGVALVLFREGQSLITLWPKDRLTSGEVKWGNYKTIYKVDTTEHSFSFSCSLPCRGDAFEFKAQVDVTYSVQDPATVVERDIADGRTVLEPLITSTMRAVTRQYDVEQSAEAEKAISEAVQRGTEDYRIGLRVDRLVVRLSLEEEARDHIRKLKRIERDEERERREAELEKQRAELEMEHVAMKMSFYRPLIEGGQWQLWALQLANNPADIATVAQMLGQQRQVDIENQLKALRIMLEEDAIEGFQIEEAGKRVLRRLVEDLEPELGIKSPDAEEHKALPEGEPDEDTPLESSATDVENATQADS